MTISLNPTLASTPDPPPVRRSRRGLRFGVGLLLLAAALWSWNRVTIDGPVQAALAEDSRNESFHLAAHRAWYVSPSTLVLSLRPGEGVSTADAFRSLFQAAAALERRGATFDRVELSRSGSVVFLLDGDDFEELGRGYRLGENPVYLLRTLPEKLHHPDGSSAYSTWEGGFLGVTGKQLEDLNDAGRTWILAEE